MQTLQSLRRCAEENGSPEKLQASERRGEVFLSKILSIIWSTNPASRTMKETSSHDSTLCDSVLKEKEGDYNLLLFMQLHSPIPRE